MNNFSNYCIIISCIILDQLGTHIIVCGGMHDGNHVWNTCETLLVGTDTWTDFPSLPTALYGMQLVNLTDGASTMFCFGGYDDDLQGPTNAVFVFGILQLTSGIK